MNDQLDDLHAKRHSLAHIMATAIKRKWPETKFGVGPVVENGFYYDVDIPDYNLSIEDLPEIESAMKKIISEDQVFEQFNKPIGDAVLWAKNETQPYKEELLNDLMREGTTIAKDLDVEELGMSAETESKVEEVSFYRNGDFTDLCRGPHVASTGQVGPFKLLRVSGAYWRGRESNPQMQRIYGVAFNTKEELDQHLNLIEEAKIRDHRKIGQDQELFYIDDKVGKGLVMWLPRGAVMCAEVEKLAIEKEFITGFERVITPHIAREELFTTSGHLPYYKDSMYPAMTMEDGTYYLKAMNCPHHHRIFLHQPKSYRDLPVRYAEYGTVYRNELSGALAGLLRVRALSMNDAHIYCTKEQIKTEFRAVLEMTMDYFALFGLKDYWFRLSKWDPAHKDKYIDEPENWEFTEKILRELLTEMNVSFVEADDEAAFYGPKVDVQFKSVIGREETMSTVQLDFSAKKRFNLSYTDVSGKVNNDVFVIHRAPLSTQERFMAFIIEHYGGKFPIWLAPEQVRIATINQEPEILEFAGKIVTRAKELGVRASVDDNNESIGKKIRLAETMKVPYTLVVGKKEIESGVLKPRIRQDLTVVVAHPELGYEEFLKTVVNESRSRTAKTSL